MLLLAGASSFSRLFSSMAQFPSPPIAFSTRICLPHTLRITIGWLNGVVVTQAFLPGSPSFHQLKLFLLSLKLFKLSLLRLLSGCGHFLFLSHTHQSVQSPSAFFLFKATHQLRTHNESLSYICFIETGEFFLFPHTLIIRTCLSVGCLFLERETHKNRAFPVPQNTAV